MIATPAHYTPPATDEERLADPWWRLCNLYSVIDEKGKAQPFKPRPAQVDYYWHQWYLNLLLKSRQHGFCLDPATRVLTAELRWRPIAELQAGDEIVAVDEHPPGGRGSGRRMRTATVQAAVSLRAPAWRITLDDGRTLTCTDWHPWLSRNGSKVPTWRSIAPRPGMRTHLKVGYQVRYVTKPWGESAFEDGWFGGLLDGEGSLKSGGQIAVSQVAGPVLERMRAYLDAGGYHYAEHVDRRCGTTSKIGQKPVHRFEVYRGDELFRLIGQTRPSRFLPAHWWEERELPGKRNGDVGWATVVAIEPVGEQTVIDLQTSTGTYIAEGFVSHNTTLLCLIALDKCIWRGNYHAHLIAHTREDSERLFEEKIRWPLRQLVEQFPPLRAVADTTEDNARVLRFPNGSTFSCGTSMRGGTLQWLHISEHGKICAKFADKAKEIRSGALNTVHAGQCVTIESTAEGREGDFYEYAEAARKRHEARAVLSTMDFRFHFYPWWKDAKNTLDPRTVVITDRHKQYFDDLARKHKIRLTPGQKAWYVKKAETQRDLMFREHPSTPEEAFQGATEGTYYGSLMLQARRQGRIVPVLHWDKRLPVETTWDLGKNDETAVWWHQWAPRDGLHRWLKYAEGSDEDYAYWYNVLEEVRAEYGFIYGRHYMPHDVMQTEQTLRKGKVKKDVWEELGMKRIVVVPKVPDVTHGIASAKLLLSASVFSEQGCEQGIIHLENYRRDLDERTGSFKDTPVHNKASNGADAFRQIAQDWYPEEAYHAPRQKRKRNWKRA